MAENASKIPFVFGITGHRDIRRNDVEELKHAILEIFREIKGDYPNTPLILLSPLAEGADRLAANVARNEGIELIVPLPLAPDEYEKDFASTESIEEFRGLLRYSSAVIEMQLPDDVVPEDIAKPGPARDHQYFQAGIYIALHSHVLIALWDGGDTGKTGGTGMIVRYQLNGLPPLDEQLPNFCRHDSTQLDLPELGPVYRVSTPRSGSPHALTSTDIELVKLYPERQTGQHEMHGEDYYQQIFSRLDTYNRDAEALLGSRERDVESSREHLFPADKFERYPSLRGIRDRFAAADILAIHFRDRAQAGLRCLAWMFVGAFLSFELFAHIWPSPTLLAFYLAILVLAWLGYFRIIRFKNWQSKYEDYRALAEALRVQFFWRLAGLSYSVADYYLRSQSDDLVWIRQSVRACNVVPPITNPGADEIRAIKQHWVDDQKAYFDKTSKWEGKIFSFRRISIRTFYITGVCVALALWVWMLSTEYVDELGLHVVIVLMGFAPAVAAAIGYVIERRGYESHIRQYQVMLGLYDRAGEALEKANNERTVSEILSTLGREALAENGGWVLLHRERRIEPVSG